MSADPKVQDTPSPSGATVRAEAVKVIYRKKTVLDVGSVSLRTGETFVLLGASGAGKSTLLRVLGLLEKPSEGQVFFEGRPANRNNLAIRRQIAAVFQKPYLLRGTVGQNVDYGLRLRHMGARERVTAVADALDRVGLAGWEDRSALTLSGGEAQRVALARALVLKPRLLLLDEPLSYLDPMLKRQLSLEFARILADEGVTALYVTHDQDEAAVVADRIGVMREGRIIAEGAPEAVLTLPRDPWVAAFLGTVTPIDGIISSAENGVARVDCAGTPVFAATELPVGTRVSLGIRPEDVLLFEPDVPLPATSARNRIVATVTDIVPSGVTVKVLLAIGEATIASSVSRSSVETLGLAPGVQVSAVFKATAVRLLPGASATDSSALI